MTNYKLIIQYDGTRYSGWQKQGNTDNTIQGKLETIASRLAGTPIDVNGSGRTDAGVHALGQVANFHGDIFQKNGQLMPPEEIRNAFNQSLPMDIRILEVSEAAPRFHARLNARQKHYRYIIDNGVVANVFERRYSARIPDIYHIDAMRQAASFFIGEHDFKSFCENKHMKKSTVRTIHKIEISEKNGMIFMDFYGNGFLYHMVRILAGTLMEVGNGKKNPEDIPAILEAKSRPIAGFTAPPQGLFLVEVNY